MRRKRFEPSEAMVVEGKVAGPKRRGQPMTRSNALGLVLVWLEPESDSTP
jgi:hypothetical protein